MNGETSRELIERFHGTPVKACLVITGAGASAIAALFGVAGASRTIIDAQVPYSRSALDSYVGAKAEQHVSKDEAKLMAIKAFQRAIHLTETHDRPERLIGLSCTAAIATERLRRGENRAHVAWHDGENGATYSLIMKKGARDRAGEEAVCSSIILNALAEACGIEDRLPLELLESEDVERVAH